MHRRVVLAALPVLAACATANPSPARVPRAVLFFTAESAALDENAREIVLQAAETAKANPNAAVRVRGFAAPDSGTGGLSRNLAEARSRQVADQLVANGVDRSRIRIESRGAVPFEQFPTESRRVEIIIGG